MTFPPRPVARFQIISWNCASYATLQDFKNGSTLLNKRAAGAKNRKLFKRHLLGQLPAFQNNFTDMFLLYSFRKIAKMVSLQWTR